ncbi:MAG: hypothetical protein ACT4QC_22180 [Planctomycetaceae bacterium]
MATRRWRGDAPKIAQVNTLTVAGTAANGQIYSVTINGKAVSYTANGSDTNNSIAAALKASLAASTIPEFAEITWTVATNVVTATARTTGKPFTNTSAATGTGTLTTSVATANSGPNVVSLAANWEGAAVPADGDDVVFDSGASDVLYDLDQNAVTPASILVDTGFRGKIGLPELNADDAVNTYAEYREKYLRYGNSGDAQTVTLTVKGGAGRIKLNTGTAQAAWNISDSAPALEDGVPAVLLKGTHSANALNVSKGDVGVALFAGETATLAVVNVGYRTNRAGDARARLGAGVSLANAAIVQTGGSLELNSSTSGSATLTQYDGTLSLNGGSHTGLAVRGGDCIYNTSGTLGGATVVSGDGHLDFSQDLRAKTVTNPIDLFGPAARLSDPHKVVSGLIVDLDETALSDNLNLGPHIRLTRGAPA